MMMAMVLMMRFVLRMMTVRFKMTIMTGRTYTKRRMSKMTKRTASSAFDKQGAAQLDAKVLMV